MVPAKGFLAPPDSWCSVLCLLGLLAQQKNPEDTSHGARPSQEGISEKKPPAAPPRETQLRVYTEALPEGKSQMLRIQAKSEGQVSLFFLPAPQDPAGNAVLTKLCSCGLFLWGLCFCP